MNTRLKHIQNWPELAKEANWSASALAGMCGVSVRTLERYFLKKLAKNPKAWLKEQRQQRAIELLRDGLTVKETANYLGYKQASTFSREFNKYWKFPPAAYIGAAFAESPFGEKLKPVIFRHGALS